MDKDETKGRVGRWASIMLVVFMITALPAWAHAGNVEKGKKIATTRSLGNCVACHYLPKVESPGDIGPSLVEAMQEYTMADRGDVVQWITDARKFNPHTIMPPFGTNKILTPEQIEDLVSYLYTLRK